MKTANNHVILARDTPDQLGVSLNRREIKVEEFDYTKGALTRTIRLCQVNPNLSAPVILFVADGQNCFGLLDKLEVASRRINRGVILIGIDSDSERRNDDYLSSGKRNLFDEHMSLTLGLVSDLKNARLSAVYDRDSCGVMGFSNGGSFALTVGLSAPEMFGKIIAFSPARDPIHREFSRSCSTKQSIYLEAGSLKANRCFKEYSCRLGKILAKDGHAVISKTAEYDHRFEHFERNVNYPLEELFGGET